MECVILNAECETWDVGCGMGDMGHRTWDMGCAMWDMERAMGDMGC